MRKPTLYHVLMNLSGVPGSPAAILVRLEASNWRKQALPIIKAVAADLAGRPVRWADINVFESMTEEEWLGFVERKTQCLYQADAAGQIERLN